jgi:hypothetical protein
MNVITVGHMRTHGFKGTKDFKAQYGEIVLVAPSKKEDHAKYQQAHNPRMGVAHSAETIRKMRENRKGKGIGVTGKYERTPEIRDKISAGVSRAIQRHTFWHGWWVESEKADAEVFVRSTWEERVLRVLDLHPYVEELEVESFVIPYIHEGVPRRYTPDFTVYFEGGIVEVWEVKPQVFWTGKNLSKLLALNDFVLRNGMNARLVTSLAEIERMEMCVGLRPWTLSDTPPFECQSLVQYPSPKA